MSPPLLRTNEEGEREEVRGHSETEMYPPPFRKSKTFLLRRSGNENKFLCHSEPLQFPLRSAV